MGREEGGSSGVAPELVQLGSEVVRRHGHVFRGSVSLSFYWPWLAMGDFVFGVLPCLSFCR